MRGTNNFLLLSNNAWAQYSSVCFSALWKRDVFFAYHVIFLIKPLLIGFVWARSFRTKNSNHINSFVFALNCYPVSVTSDSDTSNLKRTYWVNYLCSCRFSRPDLVAVQISFHFAIVCAFLDLFIDCLLTRRPLHLTKEEMLW